MKKADLACTTGELARPVTAMTVLTKKGSRRVVARSGLFALPASSGDGHEMD